MGKTITIQRSYKFRFYPTPEQIVLLTIFFGVARWVWNHALEMRSKAWKRRKESLTGVDISRHLTQLKKTSRYGWLKAAPSTILVQKLRDLDRAFSNFFDPKLKAKYPRFKKRTHAQSIRFQLDQRTVAGNYRAGEFLKLPKLGRLKLKWSRVPAGTPKMVTIKKDSAGRYFVSFVVEETISVSVPPARAVGLDVGIKSLVTTSDGQSIGNTQPLKAALRSLRRAQRALSRRTKGSGRWKAQRRRVAKIHARVRDVRQDILHKTSSRIVRDYGYIATESLNIKGMMQNRRLARAIGDAAWGEFIRQLQYKSQWYGREFQQIGTFVPSSKTCSCCGYKMDDMTLCVRSWVCPQCETGTPRRMPGIR